MERVAGIEPARSAWKAEVLPLNYTRNCPYDLGRTHTNANHKGTHSKMVEGEGFEPSKAEPADLQSAPFDRSGIPPHWRGIILDVF